MANFNLGNSALQICVDTVGKSLFGGRIYSQRLKEPLPFSNMTELLLQIENLLDAQNFPQAFQRARTFRPRKETLALAAARPEEGISAQEVSDAAGEYMTFTVNIISRRSSTWQGRIDWHDGSPAEDFSSALEFMRMADGRTAGLQ